MFKKLSKYWLPIAASVLLIGSIGLLVAISGQNGGCQQSYRNDKALTVKGVELQVEVADDDASREKGLSGRSCLADNKGMLFVFDQPGSYGFWMKDMRFSIDIVWLDKDKKVINVHKYVSPDTYPRSFFSDRPAMYVLEIGAGRADYIGLKPGDQLNFY